MLERSTYYKLSNHLGNVLTIINDVKIPTSSNSTTVNGYLVGIVNTSDYSPFGVQLDGRTVSNGRYRFGFQGQEKDDEVKGKGNSVNYKYRMHAPRIGRFFAVDPLAGKYPYNGVYNFSENRVVDGVELEGLEVILAGVSARISMGLTISGAVGIIFDFEGNVSTFLTGGIGGGFAMGGNIGGMVSFMPFADNIKEINGLGISMFLSLHAVAGLEFSGDVSYDGSLGDDNSTSAGGTISWGGGLDAAIGLELTYTTVTKTRWENLSSDIQRYIENSNSPVDEKNSWIRLLEESSNLLSEKIMEQKKIYNNANSKAQNLYEKFINGDESVTWFDVYYQQSLRKNSENKLKKLRENYINITKTLNEIRQINAESIVPAYYQMGQDEIEVTPW